MPQHDVMLGHPKAVPCVGAVSGGTSAPQRSLTCSPSLHAPWGLAEGRCLPDISPALPWEPSPHGEGEWGQDTP